MRHGNRVTLFGALAVMLLLVHGRDASAQITAATISGTVKDETGGVLPGVDLVVRNIDTGLTRAAVTDANGFFLIPGLLPASTKRVRA